MGSDSKSKTQKDKNISNNLECVLMEDKDRNGIGASVKIEWMTEWIDEYINGWKNERNKETRGKPFTG